MKQYKIFKYIKTTEILGILKQRFDIDKVSRTQRTQKYKGVCVYIGEMPVSRYPYFVMYRAVKFWGPTWSFCSPLSYFSKNQKNKRSLIPFYFSIHLTSIAVHTVNRTQTCKQEYASARHIEPCRGLPKREILQSGICPAPCVLCLFTVVSA